MERTNELCIKATVSDGRVFEFSLGDGDSVWLGRTKECAIELETRVVSRRHVSFGCRRGQLVIEDASQNGTLVDGVLLKQAARIVQRAAVELAIGRVVVRLAREPNGAPRPPVAAAPAAVLALAPLTEPADAQLPASAALRRRIHRLLLDYLELPKLDRRLNAEEMRTKVQAGLYCILDEIAAELPKALDRQCLIGELCDEVLGLGPLERLLDDPEVSEIMVVDPQTIYVERGGRLVHTGLRFTDDESVRSVIERIITPLGRRIDESTPLVDARLKDGSRVNAIIPPLALKGPAITIRKFAKQPPSMSDLIHVGSLDRRMARFLERAVRVRKNIIISGGTGSGKTTLLNLLSSAIMEQERLVTIEDAAELQLRQPHVVSLESRPSNMEGRGQYSIRDLLRNALRMRPDRIIVGECRGDETLDMLQAMNTGHEGSMTTTHANSPREALARIETLCLMSGVELPVRAIRSQIASSLHLIVQQSRFADGSRRIVSVTEVTGLAEDGEVELREIFKFERTETRPDGKVLGEFRATGFMPSFIDQFIAHGLVEGSDYL